MATYDDLASLLQNSDWKNMDASKLASLLSSSNAAAYSGMTDEEMRKQAENKYASIYNQRKLAAQQAYDATEKSINDQLASLGLSYAKQAKQTTDAVNQALSGVSNAALSRGMGRSSYTTASLGGVQNKGVEALSEILQNRTNAENALAGDLALAQQQLAQTLAGYDTDRETDIQAYMDQLRESDYTKRMEALNMQNQLAMWLAEYNAAYGNKGGGSGGGSGGSGGTGGSNKNTANNDLRLKLANALLGSNAKSIGSYLSNLLAGGTTKSNNKTKKQDANLKTIYDKNKSYYASYF